MMTYFFILLFAQLISIVIVVSSLFIFLPSRLSNLQRKNAKLSELIFKNEELTRDLVNKVYFYTMENEKLKSEIQQLEKVIEDIKVEFNGVNK